jgi:hypothetical protein
MNTSNPNPISGRIIQKICALKEFWVEPGLFLATRWTAGFGAEPTAASEIANGPLSGPCPASALYPPFELDASSGWEAVPGGHHDSPIFRRPSLPARICVVAERRLASRRHRANFSFSRVAMETGNDITLIEPLPVHR